MVVNLIAVKTLRRSSLEGASEMEMKAILKHSDKIKKSPEIMEMERIIAGVFEIIHLKNPFVMNNISPDYLKSIIERHAPLYLQKFGLELCRYLGGRIINLDWDPFTDKSTLLSFFDLCKNQKYREDEINRSKTVSTNVSSEPKMVINDIKSLLKNIKENSNA